MNGTRNRPGTTSRYRRRLIMCATGFARSGFASDTGKASGTRKSRRAVILGLFLGLRLRTLSFAHRAMLFQGGVFAVFHLHQREIIDFIPNRPHNGSGAKDACKCLPRSRWRRGLGVLDQVVEWFKPTGCPDWMTAEQYAALPESLIVRKLRCAIGRRGFRTKTVTLVTTLLDAELHPRESLAERYWVRWRRSGIRVI